MKKNGFAPLIIILVIAILGVVGYFAFKPSNPAKVEDVTPNPYDKKYVSKNLGISFNHNSCVFIQEEGNSIYLKGSQNEALDDGTHTIQVFNKASDVSLVDAINNNLLKNYKRTECFAVVSTVFPKAPSGWDEAEVIYPDDKSVMDPNNLPNCDAHYERTNGARSFWMNPQESSKYILLSLGQGVVGGCGGADINLQSITFLK